MKFLTLFALVVFFQISAFSQVMQLSNTSYTINGSTYELGTLELTGDQLAKLHTILKNQQEMEKYSAEFTRIEAEVKNAPNKTVKTDNGIASALNQPAVLKSRKERDLYYDEMTRKVIELQKSTKISLEGLQELSSKNSALVSLLSQVQKSDESNNVIRKLRN